MNPKVHKKPDKTRALPLGAQTLLALVALALIITATVGVGMHNNGRALLQDVLQKENGRKFDLLVLSAEGNLAGPRLRRLRERIAVLANSDSRLQSVRITNPAGESLLAWRRTDQVVAVEPMSFEPMSFGRAISSGGKSIARISAVWNAAASGSVFARYGGRTILLLGISCLLFALITFMALEYFTLRPVRAISQKFLECRRGNFSTQTHIPKLAAGELHDLEESSWALSEIFSDRDQNEAELVATRELARSARSAKENFMANMSHEMRTPLNAINGFAEMLASEVRGPIGNQEYVDYARNIRKAGTQLLAMIDDVLDLSHFQTNPTALRKEALDVAQAVRSSVDMVETFASLNGLGIEREIATDLPVVQADPVRFNQIMQHILSNAIKFTRPGGVVRVSAARDPQLGVVISVSDNGIGIEAEKLDSILEPFTQIENAMTRKHGGTGLGLALVTTFVELHGGSLRITSQPDVGTNVTFSLPAPRPDRDQSDVAPNAARLPSATAPAV